MAYQATMESACWFWPHKDFVMVCDRPRAINRDDRGQLHCEGGMSIEFRDGWGLWHINGVQVTEQIVRRPETQTIKQIDEESNADVRAIRMERFGTAKYLEESGCKVIDQRVHPRDELPEKLYRDKQGRHRLVVTDPSTMKQISMLVPRECVTCDQAQAFITHGADSRAACRT